MRCLAALRGDLHAGAHRARHRHHRRRVVIDHGAAGVPVTGDHVEDAGRQELGGDLGEQRRRSGRGVARLEHDGVARGDGRGELPDGHHHRVVPRRDLRAHADRLAAEHRRVPAHVLAGTLALEVPGRRSVEADLVDHRRDLLRAGQRDRLAGVAHLELDQLVGAGLDGVGDAEQRERTLRRRRIAPRLERRRRRLHGLVDVLGPGQRRRGVLLTRHGIDHRRRGAVGSGHLFTVDEVRESLHG